MVNVVVVYCVCLVGGGIALVMGSNTMGKGIPSGSKWMWKRLRVFGSANRYISNCSRGHKKLSCPSAKGSLSRCCFWFGWVEHSHKSVDIASIFKGNLDFFFFWLLYLEKQSLEHYILSKSYTHRHVPGVWAHLVKSLSQMNVSVSQAPQRQSNWCAAMFSSSWCYALPDKCKFPSSFILKTRKEYSAQQLLS